MTDLASVRWWAKLALLLLLGAFALRWFFKWFEHAQVFHPHHRFVLEAKDITPEAEDIYWATQDGVRLNGWFLPPPPPIARRPDVVLLAHGNAGNISHRLDLYQALHGLGLTVFAFDYRGYGRSGGRVSEQGTYLDAISAMSWLLQRGYRPDHIIAAGESLGGAIAAELASQYPVAGLVLQSTFTSIPDIGAELFPFLPVRSLAEIKYDNLAKLPKTQVPVLILHGRADTLVPFHHAERNFAAARSPKLLREIAGDHNDGPNADLTRFRAAWKDFLQLLDDTRQRSPLEGSALPLPRPQWSDPP